MSTPTKTKLPIDPRVLQFVKSKITEAERTLKAREDMERVWGSGTNKSWRKTGCNMSKDERLKESAMHGRIAEKNRVELQMFKLVLAYLPSA